jgi:hypothetical protein
VISPTRYKAAAAEALASLREIKALTKKLRLTQTRMRKQNARILAQQDRLREQISSVGKQLADLRGLVAVEHVRTRKELLTTREALELQHEIVATNEAAFGPYRDAFRGRDVVVVASGPTLAHYEPIPGAVHIGVNSVISHPEIPLDFYFAHDFGGGGGVPRVLAQFEDGKVPQGCKLFFGLKATTPNGTIEASQSVTARVGATRYFASPSPSRNIHHDIRFHPLADFFTIVFSALNFALFTNARRIYLVGCDASYFGHFDGTPQPETDEQVRSYLTHRLVGYRRMREFARTFYPETEIVSVNPVNLAGLFTDEIMPDAEYRTSAHQKALAAADFSDEAIATFVDLHIDEAKDRHLPI